MRGGGITSRWFRSKGKGQSTAYYADYATYADYDDDVVNPVDSNQAKEAADLDTIALLADSWDVLVSDPEVSAQLVQANAQACLRFWKGKKERQEAKRRANTLFAHHTNHWKTAVDDRRI